jgi:acyl carrier protein
MISKRSGRIVNLSSVAADKGGRGQANYAASKGAINAFTKAMAVELASRRITVNCVAPGVIETEMSQQVRELADDQPSRRESCFAATDRRRTSPTRCGFSPRASATTSPARCCTSTAASRWNSGKRSHRCKRRNSKKEFPCQNRPSAKPRSTRSTPRSRRSSPTRSAARSTRSSRKSSLIADLDAESIDFLDLVFRLEKGFGVKIPRGKIVEDARGPLPEAEFETKGVVTEAGLARLREFLSEVPAERFKTPLKAADVPRLFTTETFCKVVIRAQRALAA